MLNEKIIEMKETLNNKIEFDNLNSEQIVLISKKLDILILEYYKKSQECKSETSYKFLE